MLRACGVLEHVSSPGWRYAGGSAFSCDWEFPRSVSLPWLDGKCELWLPQRIPRRSPLSWRENIRQFRE